MAMSINYSDIVADFPAQQFLGAIWRKLIGVYYCLYKGLRVCFRLQVEVAALAVGHRGYVS